MHRECYTPLTDRESDKTSTPEVMQSSILMGGGKLGILYNCSLLRLPVGEYTQEAFIRLDNFVLIGLHQLHCSVQ